MESLKEPELLIRIQELLNSFWLPNIQPFLKTGTDLIRETVIDSKP